MRKLHHYALTGTNVAKISTKIFIVIRVVHTAAGIGG